MNYVEIIRNVLANGVPKKPTRIDNNGNYTLVANDTIGTFCEIFRHNMSDGFPLTGIRKMPWKSIRIELQGFIQGICDKKWYQDKGCKFWDEWSNPTGMPLNLSNEERIVWQFNNRDLGPLGYSEGWRNFGGYYRPVPNATTSFDKTIEVVNNKHKLCGKVIENGDYKYTVIYYNQTNKKFSVKFHDSGFVIESVPKSKLNKLTDPYHLTVHNVACIGVEPKERIVSKNIEKKLRALWERLVTICYDYNCDEYKHYGGKGVYMSNEWLIFWDFVKSVITLQGWDKKSSKWSAYDLDYKLKGGNCFSSSNSIWLSVKEIDEFRYANYYFQAEKAKQSGFGESGIETFDALGLRGFCSSNRLNVREVEKAILEERELVVGDVVWNFIDKTPDRLPKGIDQLSTILSKLINSPYDRRMVCNAWDLTRMHQMALPPCHYAWTVVVYGNRLNLCWKQRSCDLMLGVGSNIASYALLLTMLAKHAGLEPGELVGILEDCHIYSNHLEAAKELASRDETPLPTIEIDSDGDFDILKWQWNNARLINYAPHPSVEVGDVTV